jgi:hypothetical protein
MKKILLTLFIIILFGAQQVDAQTCKTTADLDGVPGQYLTAAQYPWPAARAEYFRELNTAADKALAKKTLELLEKAEQPSRVGFNLTGGNWESTFSSNGYEYAANTKLGKYYLQTAHREFVCVSGKLKLNSEFGTVLRMHINYIPVNTLNRFLQNPFGTSIGEYSLGFQYADWKNHKPTDTGDKLISLFSYITCNNPSLLEAINTGQNYFQDIDQKNVKLNTRVPHVYRYWFVKKNTAPVLIPVSRKEYLLSLLEYYEREKLHFTQLIAKFTADKNNSGLKSREGWETSLNEKISIVKNTLATQNEDWLNAQAVVSRSEDTYQNGKNKFKEKINDNRFWQFYDSEKRGEPLYQYNPEYFKTNTKGAATPQLITVAFRYVTMPSSIRLLDNFTEKFDYAAYAKLLE